jgi:hypothetical protein
VYCVRSYRDKAPSKMGRGAIFVDVSELLWTSAVAVNSLTSGSTGDWDNGNSFRAG